MKRSWAYLGALLPLSSAIATEGNAARSFDADPAGIGRKPKRGIDDEEESGLPPDDSSGGDGAGENPGRNSSVNPEDGGWSEGAGGDAASQELRGMLEELGQMQALEGAHIPIPVAHEGAMSGSSGMYAPAPQTAASYAYGGTTAEDTADDIGTVDGDTTGGYESPDTSDQPPATDGGATDSGPEEPIIADADSMLVMLGGMATGLGDATTEGDADLEIVDYGNITVAYGNATFSATADASEDGATAYADTYADVIGADLVFVYDVDNSYMTGEGADAQYTDTSTTYVVAIDFEPGHPFSEEFDAGDDNGFEHEYDPGLVMGYSGGFFGHASLGGLPFSVFHRFGGADEGEVAVEGNGADLIFNAAGEGDDGSQPVVLLGDVSTVEDSSSGSILVAQTTYGELTLASNAYGPDTYAIVEGYMAGIDGEFSTLSGLVTGIA